MANGNIAKKWDEHLAWLRSVMPDGFVLDEAAEIGFRNMFYAGAAAGMVVMLNTAPVDMVEAMGEVQHYFLDMDKPPILHS